MGKPKSLIIIGTVTLLLGLLTQFPARIAYHWIAPSEIRLSGISGTIWDGTANEGLLSGFYVHNLHWAFKPFSLLTGNLAFATQLNLATGLIDTEVMTGLGGLVRFRSLTATLPVTVLQSLIQIPGLNGSINAQFAEIKLDNGFPVAADGVVEIRSLFIRQLAPTNIGDFRIQFGTTNEGIVASVEDTAGILDLAGTLRVAPDHLYSLIGLVAPNTTTPTTVVEQLAFLGSPNARGQREFRFEGEL